VLKVALVDLLKSLGIEPDGVVGHSVGELGCAYADGTFNADQAILAAFWRGRSILESKLPQGSMAAVGKLNLKMFIIYYGLGVLYIIDFVLYNIKIIIFRFIMGRD